MAASNLLFSDEGDRESGGLNDDDKSSEKIPGEGEEGVEDLAAVQDSQFAGKLEEEEYGGGSSQGEQLSTCVVMNILIFVRHKKIFFLALMNFDEDYYSRRLISYRNNL